MAKSSKQNIFLRFLLILVFLGLVLIGGGFFHPEIFFHPNRLVSVLKIFKPGITVIWKEVAFQTEMISWTQRRISLNGRELCILDEGNLDVCVKSFRVDLEVGLSWQGLTLEQIHTVQVSFRKIEQITSKGSEDAEVQIRDLMNSLPLVNRVLQASDGIMIEFERLKVPGEEPFRGELIVENSKVEIHVSQASPKEKPDKKAKLILTPKKNQIFDLHLYSDLSTPEPLDLTATIDTRKIESEGIAQAKFLAQLGPRDLQAELVMTLRESSFLFQGKAEFSNRKDTMENASLNDCEFQYQFETHRFETFSCLIEHRLDQRFSQLIQLGLLPKKVQGKVVLESSGRISLRLTDYQSDLIEYSGLTQLNDRWEVAQVQLKISLQNMAELIRIYQKSGYPIVSPFHVLRGKVDLTIESEGRPADQGELPIRLSLKTDLASKNQRLLSELSAGLELNVKKKRIQKLNADWVLQEIKLVLPRLGLESPPQVFRDDRIGSDTAGSKKGSKQSFLKGLQWQLRFRSQQPDSVKLISNLAKQPVPINLKGSCTEKGCHGMVETEMVSLNLLKRDATIVAFQYRFDDQKKSSALDGRLRVDYADYSIRIHLIGSLENPRVQFESVPPLSQEDTMAVLLFGSPMSTLSGERANAARDTSDAVADQALGLASLFYLASTPIESVRYDAQTRIFSAKVALGGGASFVIGTDSQQVRSVGVRKRIGTNFAVTSEIPSNPTSSDSSVTGFLEWFTRY